MTAFHCLIHRILNIPLSIINYSTKQGDIYSSASYNGKPHNIANQMTRNKTRAIVLNFMFPIPLENVDTKFCKLNLLKE